MAKIVIWVLLIASTTSASETLKITCDSNKNLVMGTVTQSECGSCSAASLIQAPREVLALSEAIDSKIQIRYPYSGPNKSIQSSNYDPEVIKKLIDLAITNNVDPYLVLGISLLESPPVKVAGGRGRGYEYGYGDFPIDALPLYDMLGCVYKTPNDKSFKYATPEQVQKLKPLYENYNQSAKTFKSVGNTLTSFRNFVVKKSGGSDGNHIYKILKSLYEAYPSGCPVASVKKEISDSYCTNPKNRQAVEAMIKYYEAKEKLNEAIQNSNLSSLQEAEVSARLESSSASAIVPNKSIPEFKLPNESKNSTYLCSEPASIKHGERSRFNQYESAKDGLCCAKVVGFKDKSSLTNEFLNFMAARFVKTKISTGLGTLSSLALDIQKYNGLGTIGSTEGLSNDCLNGINMKERPYYGARAADLLINSLMSNAQINKMIEESSKNSKKPVISVLCQKVGIGSHQIEKKQFLNLQKDYLITGRPDKHSVCVRNFEK